MINIYVNKDKVRLTLPNRHVHLAIIPYTKCNSYCAYIIEDTNLTMKTQYSPMNYESEDNIADLLHIVSEIRTLLLIYIMRSRLCDSYLPDI